MLNTIKNVGFTALTGFFLLIFVAAGGFAADGMKWESQVAGDALRKLGCEVSYISHVVERELPGGTYVMAKVHCEDKRSFDAIRENDTAPFTFKECTPREQKSC